MTAAIQYILTAAQSLGSLRFTIKSLECPYLGLLVYYSAKTSRYRQNGFSYVPKKILTWKLREAGGGLKLGSHDPILVQLSFQIFLCMMKNVGVHTIQISQPIISCCTPEKHDNSCFENLGPFHRS